MHHPLRDYKFRENAVDNHDVGNTDQNDDDDNETIASTITSSSLLSESEHISSRPSQMSLDPNRSYSQLASQIKGVPLRYIKKPDFPAGLPMHLIQELHVRYAVFCVSASPDGHYLAIGGGDRGGGYTTVYSLFSDILHVPTDVDLQVSSNYALYDGSIGLEMQRRAGATLCIAWTSRPSLFFTAGMDKLISLWHLDTPLTPLMLFPHPDVVSCMAVHPRDDRLLASGCIDGRVRVWSVEAAKVVSSADLPHPLTAIAFAPTGKTLCAGTASGHLFVYGFEYGDNNSREVNGLKYHSQIHVRSKRGKNASGTAKVSGLQFVEGPTGDPYILVTTNDSRVRYYRLRDKEVKVKFQGIVNEDSQLQAAIQRDIVCCASEDGRVALWKMPDLSKSFLTTLTEKIRGRNLVDSMIYFRAALGKVKSGDDQNVAPAEEAKPDPGQPLSTAIFLPEIVCDLLLACRLRQSSAFSSQMRPKHIVTGDMTGKIKVFEWGTNLTQ